MEATILQHVSGINELERTAQLLKDRDGSVIHEIQQRAAQVASTADADLTRANAEALASATSAERSPCPGLSSDPTGDAVKLAKPEIPVDTPQFLACVAEGIKREIGTQNFRSEIPRMAGVIGTIMAFTSQPTAREIKHELRQPEHPATLTRVGAENSPSSVGSLFGESAFERAFEVMLDLTNALQESRRAENALEGKMAMMMRAAAETSAQATQAQGREILLGAAAGSGLQIVLAGLGAQRQFSGLRIKANSIENQLRPQAELRRLDRELSLELRGAGGGRLEDEHANALSQENSERQHRIDMYDIKHKKDEIIGDRLRTQGTVFDALGGISKNLTDGVTGTMVHNFRAQQTLAENDEKVTASVSDAHLQNAQKIEAMTEKILEIAMNAANDNAAVASQVASGIKV
ncbi:invasin C [Paraburkholderia youngii]|uniref:IpaC/SipC family type III secretion system effector n=1 Tax=Paraburkholderia youngii TaxID=2782701 RepID=UPI003D214DAF